MFIYKKLYNKLCGYLHLMFNAAIMRKYILRKEEQADEKPGKTGKAWK